MVELTKQQKQVQTARKMYMGHMFGKVYLSPEGLEMVVKTLEDAGMKDGIVVNNVEYETV